MQKSRITTYDVDNWFALLDFSGPAKYLFTGRKLVYNRESPDVQLTEYGDGDLEALADLAAEPSAAILIVIMGSRLNGERQKTEDPTR